MPFEISQNAIVIPQTGHSIPTSLSNRQKCGIKFINSITFLPNRKKVNKTIILLTKIFIFTFFSIIIIILSLYVYAFITPKFNINTSKSITYYDKYGNDLFQEREKNDYVELKNISDYVKNSIVTNQGSSGTKDRRGATKTGLYDLYSLLTKTPYNLIKEFHSLKSDAKSAKYAYQRQMLLKNELPSISDIKISKDDTPTKNYIESLLLGAGLKAFY